MVGLAGEFALPEELNDELVLICRTIESALSGPGDAAARKAHEACNDFREALSCVWADLVYPTGARDGVPCGFGEVFRFMGAAATVSYHAQVLDAALLCQTRGAGDKLRLDALFARKIEEVCDAVRLHFVSVFEQEETEISD